jgi:hypothetical protein
MSEVQKTAVELFATALYEGGYLQGNGDEIQKLLEQHLETEKDRIIKAYNQDLNGGLSGYRKFNDGEDYYNGTYGGNE